MVSATSGVSTISPESRFDATAAMTADAFLELLCAQLQNQDPSEPMNSEAMLAQISQLSTVAQMTKLNELIEASAEPTVPEMAGLIGATVEYVDPITEEVLEGEVTRVQRGNEGWQICMGEEITDIGYVVAVQ